MNTTRRTVHDLKCIVFKNNYTKLRDGFKSCPHIKAFLYSRAVINADIRDSNDVERILSLVETQLKFSEETWDILMTGMCGEPPLDVLSTDLQLELSSYIEQNTKRPQTEPQYLLHSPPHVSQRPYTSSYPRRNMSLPILDPSDKTPVTTKRDLKDSGCDSTTLLEQSGYPENYFPPPIKHNPTKRSPSNASSNASSNDSSNDSGFDPSPKNSLPVSSSSSVQSSSELVHPVTVSSTDVDHCDNSTVNSLSLKRKMTDLQMENASLRHKKELMVNELKELENEREYLLKIRKDDQQLLKVKMKQIALDNETLEKKEEFISRVEEENDKLRKDLKAVLSESEELAIRNEELMCRLSLAERNTSLSAITIDRLKQDIANRENIIDDLKAELSQWKEWYEAISRSEEPSETYFSRTETR